MKQKLPPPKSMTVPKWRDFEHFDTEMLVAGRGYWFVMAVLVVVIVTVSVLTAKQSQERHAVYRELTKARDYAYELDIEQQRLVVEQQTFSATPIVAKRAVNELGMYYPSEKEKLIITQQTPTP